MPAIHFIEPDGADHVVDGNVGGTVMEAAQRHDVRGIVAACGGALACGTCHVYVDPAWFAAAGPISPAEDEMLDFTGDRRATSRLSCQIRMTAALDRIVVHVAENCR